MISVMVLTNDGETSQSQIKAQIIAAAEQLPPSEQVEILFVNSGSASARNEMLEHAYGEYICFVYQDDILKPDMLSVFYRDIEKSGADFVQVDASISYDGGKHSTCKAGAAEIVLHGTERYAQNLQSLLMHALVHNPDSEVPASVGGCMFRMEFLRENNISFYHFCDEEDDWIFLVLAMVSAKKICIGSGNLYRRLIHNTSERCNVEEKTHYVENFYEKHRLLRAFFQEAWKHADLTEQLEERFECELQRQALLGSLSNEAGCGNKKYTEPEIVDIMVHIVEREAYEGICRHINRHPLYISGEGVHGVKRWYYTFRDKLIIFLLLHKQIPLAVRLNRRAFHGSRHI